MSKLLDGIGAFLETERKNELSKILFALRRELMNLPCDTSATASVYDAAFRAGHKQARHAAVERINELFSEVLEPEPRPETLQRAEPKAGSVAWVAGQARRGGLAGDAVLRVHHPDGYYTPQIAYAEDGILNLYYG